MPKTKKPELIKLPPQVQANRHLAHIYSDFSGRITASGRFFVFLTSVNTLFLVSADGNR